MAEREDLSFVSGEERCAAWLYRPEAGGGEAGGGQPVPIVILAHGFCGTREARLWAYGERFAQAGIAALVFDYRYFGDSGGERRQLLSIPRQLEDWKAAVEFVRTLPGIDPARIALWGTSFSGGHVVSVAAEDSRIAAVISQTPFADGVSALNAARVVPNLRLTAAAARDGVRKLLGREPFMVPAVARPGELGAMTQPDSLSGYEALFERPGRFRNEFEAGPAMGLGFYRPTAKASQVLCPLLVITCAGDRVTPARAAAKMAAKAPHGRHIEYGPEWGGHFQIYVGELFEKTIADQIAFLREALGVPELAAAAAGAEAS